MNINENIIEFEDYVAQTNYKEERLDINKYYHSIRVSQYAQSIALSLGLNEKDIYIASLAGLLHDISRFNEWNKYKIFREHQDFDHGDESYNILKKDDYISAYTLDEEIQDIVLKACKYHNKYRLPKNLNERTKLFCNIIRDADKIDILACQRCREKGFISLELLESFKNQEMCKNSMCKTNIDYKIRNLSLIFDINYSISFEILKQKNVVKSLINNIEEYCENKDILDEIVKIVENRLNEVTLC